MEARYITIKILGFLYFVKPSKITKTMNSEDSRMVPIVTDFKSYEEKASEKFNQLASLNVNEKTESKNGLTYLNWSSAWLEFKKVYPTATYNIIKNPQTGLPYFVDSAIGIMVFTEVEAAGLKYSMWLPVLDASNKAMRTEAYTYQFWDKTTKQYGVSGYFRLVRLSYQAYWVASLNIKNLMSPTPRNCVRKALTFALNDSADAFVSRLSK